MSYYIPLVQCLSTPRLPFGLPITGRKGIARPYTLEVSLQIQEIFEPASAILNPDTRLLLYPVLLPRNVKPEKAIIENENGALLSNGAALLTDVPVSWQMLVPAKLTTDQYAKLLAMFVEGQN